MSYTRRPGLATSRPARRGHAAPLVAAAWLTASAAAVASAQGDCFPPRSSNEAKTFAIFAVPLAFGPVQAPGPAAAPGRVQLGFEVVRLPNVSDDVATPTVCRPGKGPENTDLLELVPRPRIGVEIGSGWSVEASWIPPIRHQLVKANLFGLAIAWSTALGSRAAVAMRGHGTFGTVRAPITCDDEALADPASECHQGTRSDDRYRPGIAGVDASLGWAMAGGRLRPYVGAGVSRLAPRFQVNFTNAVGSTDNRRVEVDLDRAVIFGGATWAPTSAVSLSAEVYSAPTDAVTGRVALRWALAR